MNWVRQPGDFGGRLVAEPLFSSSFSAGTSQRCVIDFKGRCFRRIYRVDTPTRASVTFSRGPTS